MSNNRNGEGFFEQYWRYTSALRHWFIAYGIGGVVLFVTKAEIFVSILPNLKITIVILFLTGAIIQVVLAFWNKLIHWYLYYGEDDKTFQDSAKYKFFNKASELFWADITADVITFLSFLIATIILICSFS